MNALVLVLVIVAEVTLLVRTVRGFGFLPSPTLILGTIVLEQLTLWFVSSQTLDNEFLWTYSHGGVYTEYYKTEFFYAALFLFFYLSHVGSPASGMRFSTKITVAAKDLESINAPAAGAILVLELVFCAVLRWPVAWHNGQYLAMADADIVLTVRGTSFLLVMVLAGGLLSTIMSALNFSANNRLWAWFFALLAALPMLYQLGAHSRTSALFPLMFALALDASSGKRLAAAKSGAIVLVFLFISSALVGRAGYEHGFSTVPATFANAFNEPRRTANDLLTNIFEGSSVVAESFGTGANFSPTYKVLSLSPTPSFIDGFASIRAASEHRLSYFAPMSGFVEVMDFGPVYLVIFLAMIAASVRLNLYQSRWNYTAFLIANLFLFTGFFALNTYSARSGLKWFWISDVLAVSTIGISILRSTSRSNPGNASARLAAAVGQLRSRAR